LIKGVSRILKGVEFVGITILRIFSKIMKTVSSEVKGGENASMYIAKSLCSRQKYIPMDHMFNQINNSKSNFIQVYLCKKKKTLNAVIMSYHPIPYNKKCQRGVIVLPSALPRSRERPIFSLEVYPDGLFPVKRNPMVLTIHLRVPEDREDSSFNS
jgi:hypothetical protein